MLITTRRRLIAACASVLLILGLGVATPSPSQADDHPGLSRVAGYVWAGNIDVRIYKATGDDSHPWDLFTLVKSGIIENHGPFEAWVPDGTYRVTFNEFDDGTSNWDVFFPADWVDHSDKSTFDVYDGAVYWFYDLGGTTLKTRGGHLSGAVHDICYDSPGAVYLEAYAADDPDPDHAHRWGDGYASTAYTGNALAGPTKFRAVSANHDPQWIGGDSFDTATPFTIAPGESQAGPDLYLQRDFDPTTNVPFTGKVLDARDGYGVPGLTVRFYHSESGDDAGPWTFAGQTTTSTGENQGSNLERGEYEKDLPGGLYRATINEIDDGSVVSKTWEPTAFGGDDLASAANLCGDAAEPTVLTRAGGLITGTVTDARGNPLGGTQVSVYDGDDGSGLDSEAVYTTTADPDDGTYKVHSITGPVKLRFTKQKVDVAAAKFNRYLPEWSGDASDFEHASTTSAAVGQTTSGVDATLADFPFVLGSLRVSGGSKPLVGHWVYPDNEKTAYSDEGKHFFSGMTYQWFRTKVGKTVPIAGAHKAGYEATYQDLGARLSVREHFTPQADYPSASAGTSTSPLTASVKTSTRAVVTGKASGHKITVKTTVTMNRVPKAYTNGKVRVLWIALKQKGRYLYPTGKTMSKLVAFKHGKASYTFKVSKKGYWEYAAYVPVSSTTLESRLSRAKFLKVK